MNNLLGKHFLARRLALKNHALRRLLALGTALLVVSSPAMAASPDELTEIRNQLQNLLQRVERLEQENQTLKAQNETLQNNQTSNQTVQAEPQAQTAGAKSASWTERVALKGDLRYRHEQLSDDTLTSSGTLSTADRYRDRIRARIRAEVQATDDVTLGIGFATVEGGDPRSSNQTLGNLFSRKSVDLDLAYFDWSIGESTHLIGGKMKQPFFKPGQSLFWDGDINPEGLALRMEHGVLFGTAYSYWLDEVSGPQNARTSDTMLFGGQLGARLPVAGSELVVAAHYYDLSAGQGRAPFYNGNPYGNTTVPIGTPATPVLLYDYQVVDLMAEVNMNWDAPWGTMPLQFWADFAQNRDADELDTAWGTGVVLGETASANTWMIAAEYHSIEKDALFAQLLDADIGGGVTDVNGWVLRTGYAPAKNLTLNATYFLNKRNVDVPNAVGQTDVDHERLQIDVNLKF